MLKPLPVAFAALTVLLMAASLMPMLWRLVRMFRGLNEEAPAPPHAAGLRGSLLAACVGLGACLALYGFSLLAARWQFGTWGDIWQRLPSLWIQWDARHYLALAENWYVNTGNERLMLVFFPLFPLLVRGLRLLIGDAFWAAALLNCLCTACGCGVLYALARRRYGARLARLAVAYLLLNPFAVFLAAPYSEALFLALTLAALLASDHGRWGWAALFGALSAATRMLGLVVCGVIALQGLQRALKAPGWWRRLLRCGPPALAALGVGVGFGAYLLLNVLVSGKPFTFLEYQRTNWSQEFGSFWRTAYTTADYGLRLLGSKDFVGTWLPQAISMVAVMALIALAQHRLPLAWAAYSWAYAAIALAPTWLLSGPRYLMAMATLPLLQAVLTRKTWVHAVSLTAQGALLLLCTYGYAIARIVL